MYVSGIVTVFVLACMMLLPPVDTQILQEGIYMKKILSTIVAVGFISSMLANSAYAGERHGGGGINPLWIPIAIISTLAAVTISQPQQVVYERRADYEPRRPVIYEEPRQTVVYQEPRDYEHDRYYERGRDYEAPRYREYR
jgi:hypothetical protein